MKKILFVCLGNICRSPAAEGIFWHKIKQNDQESNLYCDSAGTSGYHEGEPADERMQAHANQRGYKLESLARPFRPETDFMEFDLILTMDNSNYENILKADQQGLFKNKIHKMTDYCKIHDVQQVPDPYFGGDEGFHLVLDILEDACQELYDQLLERSTQP